MEKHISRLIEIALLCYITGYFHIDVAGLTPQGCPNGWLDRAAFCFMFRREPATRLQARQRCGQDGGDLLNVWEHSEWNYTVNGQWNYEGEDPLPVAARDEVLWTNMYLAEEEDILGQTVLTWEWSDFSLYRPAWMTPDDEYYNMSSAAYNSSAPAPHVCAAISLPRAALLALPCDTLTSGYVCKKARPTGYYLGELSSASGAVRQPEYAHALGQAAYFRRVWDLIPVYQTTDLLMEEGYQTAKLHLCADTCLAYPQCVYFALFCINYASVCDRMNCEFRKLKP